MKNEKRAVPFIMLTPVFFILALWVSAFPHEYAHSITALLFGYKLNPLDIDYGRFDWKNVLFVDGIDEQVNYFLIYLFGDRFAMGMIAFAGPFIATLLLYVASLLVIRSTRIERRPYLLYFVIWNNVTNLSEVISYVVLRSITKHGDLGHIEFAWGVSQWFVFIVGCVLLSIATWNFFSRTLVVLYQASNKRQTTARKASGGQEMPRPAVKREGSPPRDGGVVRPPHLRLFFQCTQRLSTCRPRLDIRRWPRLSPCCRPPPRECAAHR